MKRFVLALLLASSPLLAAGCRPADDEIKTYAVKHPGREKIRLLAAMVPVGDKTWFFKLSGPEQAVAGQKENFDQFLAALRFDEKQEPPVQWTAPKGWKEEPGNKFREATFRIDAKPPLELTVVALPGKAGTLLDNVNRWRGQIALPPLEQGELDQVVTRRKVGDRAVTVVDMTGVGSADGGAPMGGMPPLAKRPPVQRPGLPFTFDVPKEWKKQQPPAPVSVESYEITQDNQTALVTLTPLGGTGGGLAANVQRWRGQVGLPTDGDPLQGAVKLPVAGQEATYVDLNNPAGPAGKNRILAVVLPQEGMTWFVKMTGPSELVGRQKENFETFVQSFQRDAR